ncbi:tetratricopeptide repeat protein [Dactylosporangium sp. AC04546]|uniref:ATP-binding protein n=1 Tax=Dactylosporangium sp. AC04546 TaxID=2862460 RepID=UPI001EE0B685|nr:tetratricopeptide repeat protein [Dactylosporangium sp. AC04546]WVK86314.1 tetratricopeptide repeat protein [Dactylosporangium sp. AC04546]
MANEGGPEPATATGPASFVAVLRELRAWSGRTYRELAARADAVGDALPASTIASTLSRSSLPRRDFVLAFTRACGLDEAAAGRWAAVRDALAAQAVAEPAAPAEPSAAPAMLPPDIADFTGRAALVARLCETLTGDRPATAPVIVALAGMGGIGKTALAVHVAHRVAEAYPDGQLYVNLRGVEAAPLEPVDVVARFLRALGVDSRAMPDDPEERTALLRTRLAGRRFLLVLDNALSEEQVRPLLPGAATCAVVITSRVRLKGIEGARFTDLDVYSDEEAAGLLARMAGADRLASRPAEAAELVALCAGLPLAVRIAGARLAARPTWPVGRLVALLRGASRPLDALDTGDLAVRASLALSYRWLNGTSQRLFRLLGLFDAPDFPVWLPAVVLDCSLEEAAELAEALVDAQLLTDAGTDAAGQYRYRFHDLVRLYARERARAEEPDDDMARVLGRGLGGWLVLAEHMARRIPGPCFAEIRGPAPRPATAWAEGHVHPMEPVDWFDAEREALLSAVYQACRLGLDALAFDLAGCLEKYFDLRGMYRDWTSTNTAVLAACRRAGNRLGEAVMLRGLIDVMTWAEDRTDGTVMARLRTDAFRLLEMFEELGDERGVSDAAVMCAWALAAAADHDSAIAMGERALRSAERSGHVGGLVRANLVLAVAKFERASYDAAVGHADAALDHARALGNARAEATVLQYLGIGHRELGNLELAQRMLGESLAISRRYRDNYTETLTLVALARVYQLRGDPLAHETAELASALSREYNMTHHLADSLGLLGELELAAGRPRHAIEHLQQSVALWRTRGWHSYQASALSSLGQAFASVDPAAARAAFEEARTLFRRVGNDERAAELTRIIEHR